MSLQYTTSLQERQGIRLIGETGSPPPLILPLEEGIGDAPQLAAGRSIVGFLRQIYQVSW